MRNCLSRDAEDGYYRPARFRSNPVAAALFSITFLTLFIGFHLTLYGTTVYQLQIQEYPSALNRQDFRYVDEFSVVNSTGRDDARVGIFVKKKLHFSKTKRRLPQVNGIMKRYVDVS